MKSGSDLLRDVTKSTVQKPIREARNENITKAVEELDIKPLSLSKIVRIADLGCSAGPNTFSNVQTIIESFEDKFRKSEVIAPEFQVFFNDLASNDFNKLFTSLPRDMKYFAAGVPGSFHGPLFPKDSLHFVYSSYGVHWLSRVPEEVMNKGSPAWNKGRVHYSNSKEEVARAYEAQFRKDMDTFLKFRAQEIVDGGVMAYVIPGRSNGTPHSQASINKGYELLGYALADMAEQGKVRDEKLDSFNLPLYHPSLEEVELAVKCSGCYSIGAIESVDVSLQVPHPKIVMTCVRTILEGLVKEHFGKEILDELFGTFLAKNLMDFTPSSESSELIHIFGFLKCVKNNE